MKQWILRLAFGIISSVISATVAFAAVTYDPHGKRDPFLPLVSVRATSSPGELLSVENLDDVRLEGVIYDPKSGSVAIINGSVVKEGQELGGFKLIKISPNGIQFSINGTEAFRSLYQDDKTGVESGVS